MESAPRSVLNLCLQNKIGVLGFLARGKRFCQHPSPPGQPNAGQGWIGVPVIEHQEQHASRANPQV